MNRFLRGHGRTLTDLITTPCPHCICSPHTCRNDPIAALIETP